MTTTVEKRRPPAAMKAPTTDQGTLQRLEDFPQVCAENDKLADLEAQLHDTEAELDDVLENVQTLSNGQKDLLSMEASALVDGDNSDEKSVEVVRDRVPQLNHKIAVLTRAVALQTEKAARARGEASAEICKRFFPIDRARVWKIADTWRELDKLMHEQWAGVDDLRDSGVGFQFPLENTCPNREKWEHLTERFFHDLQNTVGYAQPATEEKR